jgi:hypothetical protein
MYYKIQTKEHVQIAHSLFTEEQWKAIAMLVDRAGFLSDIEKKHILSKCPRESHANLVTIQQTV